MLLLNWTILMCLISSWKTPFNDASRPEQGPKNAVVSSVCVFPQHYNDVWWKDCCVCVLAVGVVLHACLRETMCEVKIVQVVFALCVFTVFVSRVTVCVFVMCPLSWQQLHMVGDFSCLFMTLQYTAYVCVFVGASHRESVVQSHCAGELICIPWRLN